jgi:hypothetical protein
MKKRKMRRRMKAKMIRSQLIYTVSLELPVLFLLALLMLSKTRNRASSCLHRCRRRKRKRLLPTSTVFLLSRILNLKIKKMFPRPIVL